MYINMFCAPVRVIEQKPGLAGVSNLIRFLLVSPEGVTRNHARYDIKEMAARIAKT